MSVQPWNPMRELRMAVARLLSTIGLPNDSEERVRAIQSALDALEISDGASAPPPRHRRTRSEITAQQRLARQQILAALNNLGSAGHGDLVRTCPEFAAIRSPDERTEILKRMRSDGLVESHGKNSAARWSLVDGTPEKEGE